MTRFALTPAAKADLVELYDLIEQDDPRAASRVLARLRTAMRRDARGRPV